MRKPDHHEQRGLSHPGIGEDKQLPAAIGQEGEIPLQKGIDAGKGTLPAGRGQLLVLVVVHGIMILAVWFHIVSGQIERGTECVANLAKFLAPFVVAIGKMLCQGKELLDQLRKPVDGKEG